MINNTASADISDWIASAQNNLTQTYWENNYGTQSFVSSIELFNEINGEFWVKDNYNSLASFNRAVDDAKNGRLTPASDLDSFLTTL